MKSKFTQIPYIVYVLAFMSGIAGGCYLATHDCPKTAILTIVLSFCLSVKTKTKDDENDKDDE